MSIALPTESALEIAARMWCLPATEECVMQPEVAVAFAHLIDHYRTLLELAWGVIANAGGGNWELETTDWNEAAVRWREQYHQTLSDGWVLPKLQQSKQQNVM